MNEHPAWIVFYGTLTTFVRAATEEGAYQAFLVARAPRNADHGRYVPPAREEVTIRRPSESDRAWIVESGDPAWLVLLPELVA